MSEDKNITDHSLENSMKKSRRKTDADSKEIEVPAAVYEVNKTVRKRRAGRMHLSSDEAAHPEAIVTSDGTTPSEATISSDEAEHTEITEASHEAECPKAFEASDITEQSAVPNNGAESVEIIDSSRETGQPEAPEVSDESVPSDLPDEANKVPGKKSISIIKLIRIVCTAGFIIFAALFVNEVFIQPHKTDVSNRKAKDLYTQAIITIAPTEALAVTIQSSAGEDNKSSEAAKVSSTPTPTPDPTRDSKGRLLQFQKLLEANEDVKGWLTINNLNGKNDTKIDYVVMQSGNDDPEYYLTRDWKTKEYLKSGSLFLDYKSSVEKPTQNLVIHGHNMTSTDDMFHYLLKYNDLDYYAAHPLIKFDTIYQTGDWKIFSIFITNGTSDKEPLFNYTRSEFKDSSDFLNFVYQLRIRSLFNIDTVDINENDQLLMLSTCSYEVKNYRTVIVARKVRPGEDTVVDTASVTKNEHPLYPGSYYYRYGGKAPKLPESFEAALEDELIKWYNPLDSNEK